MIGAESEFRPNPMGKLAFLPLIAFPLCTSIAAILSHWVNVDLRPVTTAILSIAAPLIALLVLLRVAYPDFLRARLGFLVRRVGCLAVAIACTGESLHHWNRIRDRNEDYARGRALQASFNRLLDEAGKAPQGYLPLPTEISMATVVHPKDGVEIDGRNYTYLGHVVRSQAGLLALVADGGGVGEPSSRKTLEKPRRLAVRRAMEEEGGGFELAVENPAEIPLFIEHYPNAHYRNGGLVLYANGENKFIDWESEWPMTPAAMKVLRELEEKNLAVNRRGRNTA